MKHLQNKKLKWRFKNSIASVTRKISIFLKRECEDFGMTKGLYASLMHYNNTHRKDFKNIMDIGCFYFEGRNDYETKLIVISVGNDSDIVSSHVPNAYLESLMTAEEISKKRKLSVRGPDNKEFKSVKTAAVLSKSLTEIIIKSIDSTLTEYSTDKRNQIIECAIQSIRKQFNIHHKINVDDSEINNKIVYSLKDYLSGLNNYGGKYSLVEATKDTLLAAVSVRSLSNNGVGDVLGVSKKRMAAAKQRRTIFDDVVKIKSVEEDEVENDGMSTQSSHSSDYSKIDEYEVELSNSEMENDNTSDDSEIEMNEQNREKEKSVIKKNTNSSKTNVFFRALSPKLRKVRKDN